MHQWSFDLENIFVGFNLIHFDFCRFPISGSYQIYLRNRSCDFMFVHSLWSELVCLTVVNGRFSHPIEFGMKLRLNWTVVCMEVHFEVIHIDLFSVCQRHLGSVTWFFKFTAKPSQWYVYIWNSILNIINPFSRSWYRPGPRRPRSVVTITTKWIFFYCWILTVEFYFGLDIFVQVEWHASFLYSDREYVLSHIFEILMN